MKQVGLPPWRSAAGGCGCRTLGPAWILVLAWAVPSTGHAFPTPLLLGAVGGVFVWPLLIVMPLVLLVLRHLAVRTGLRRRWRMHRRIVSVVLLVLAGVGIAWVRYGFGDPRRAPERISAGELQRALVSPTPPLLIDLRPPEDFARWHLGGARNMRPDDPRWPALLAHAPQTQVVIYCVAGMAARLQAAWMTDLAARAPRGSGFASLVNGADGVQLLADDGAFGAVKIVPQEVADLWVRLGLARSVDLGAEPAEAVRDLVARGPARLPAALRVHGVDPDEVERRLGPLPRAAHFYVATDGSIPAPGAVSLRLADVLRRLTGSAVLPIALVWCCGMAIAVLARSRELRAALAGERSRWHWAGVVAMVGATVAVDRVAVCYPEFHGFSFAGTPFPGNTTPHPWIVLCWLLLTTGVWVNIDNPASSRTRMLVELLRAAGRGQWRPLVLQLRWGRSPFIASAMATGVLALGWRSNLPTMAAIVVGLHAPLVIDATLAAWIRARFRRGPRPDQLLRAWSAIRLTRDAASLHVDTGVPSRPGRIRVRAAGRSFEVGAWSGCVIGDGSDGDATAAARAAALARRVRRVFGTDLTLGLTPGERLTQLEIVPDPSAAALVRDAVHAAVDSTPTEDLDAIRFDRCPFDELDGPPTPLTFDLLRARWRPGGGALRARQRLGVRSRAQDPPGAQLVLLGRHLYADREAERELFRTSALGARLRRFMLAHNVALEVEGLEHLWDTLIEPRARARMARARAHQAARRASARRLLRQAVGALRPLWEEAARWQEHAVVLHQDSWRQLEAALARHGLTAEHAFAAADAAPEPRPARSAAFAYELRRAVVDTSRGRRSDAADVPADVRELVGRWRVAERVRVRARGLYLEELAEASAVLHGAGDALGVGGDLAFASLDELRWLARSWRPRVHRDDLARRKEHWHARQGLALPSRLSLHDLEALTVDGGAAAAESSTGALRGLRVAGPRRDVFGRALVVRDGALEREPGPYDIVVLDHGAPDLVARLSRCAGLVCEGGGLLSHAAIQARELALPTVMGADGASRRLRSGQAIRLSPDGEVVSEDGGSADVMPLERAVLDPLAGGKAQRLAALAQRGFPVPTGVLVSHRLLGQACRHWGVPEPRLGDGATLPSGLRSRDLPPAVRAVLSGVLTGLDGVPGGVIVRSSADIEDVPGRSFAGRFRSERTTPDERSLVEAACRCWESAWEVAATTRNGLHGSVRLNLLVQPHVRASVGGVLFTADPRQPALRHLVIEVASGGAERVVTGHEGIARLVLSRTGDVLERVGPADLLGGEVLETLRALALAVEALFGAPQDIEWVRGDSGVVLVQARDV